jgi:hypothetical protein
MKTYSLLAPMVMALSFVACEKSTVVDFEQAPTNLAAAYTLFLKSNNRLNTYVLGSTDEGLVMQNGATAFGEIPSNSLKYRAGEEISFYYTSNCEASLQIYNAANDTATELKVFVDLDPCTIEVTAIAHTNHFAFLSYVRELEGKDREYMVRFISLTTDIGTFIDIPLEKKPVDLVPSLNRLFVLTLNEFVTNEFHLSVIDMTSKDTLMEVDLGFDATKLFKNNANKIIISYPELHTTLDPISLEKTYTMYGKDTAPGFLSTKDSFMDSKGRMFFQKTIQAASIETVPAIYDFEKNNTVVYLYENFLTEAELNVQYNIGMTTSIGYDEKNDFVLIGYQKKGQQDKGGILRISPSPDFKIIDNIDLEGVPQTIFVN